MTYGPSTLHNVGVTSVSGILAQATEDCKINPSVSASCDVTLYVSTEGFSSTITTSTVVSPISAYYTDVTVTGGVQKLASATGPSGSAASATSSSGSSSSASGSAGSSTSASSSSSASSVRREHSSYYLGPSANLTHSLLLLPTLPRAPALVT